MAKASKGSVGICLRDSNLALATRRAIEDAGWCVADYADAGKALESIPTKIPEWIVLDSVSLMERLRRLEQEVGLLRICFVSEALDGMELGLVFGADLSIQAPLDPAALELPGEG